MNNREIANSYKFNITTKIIYKNNDYNELNKISFIQSRLTINSINNFDFGNYYCKARNVIGEAIDSVKVERKRAPDVVKNVSIIKIESNSLVLSWLSGSNGGENQMFLININGSINVSVPMVAEKLLKNEFQNESVEIKSIFRFTNKR